MMQIWTWICKPWRFTLLLSYLDNWSWRFNSIQIILVISWILWGKNIHSNRRLRSTTTPWTPCACSKVYRPSHTLNHPVLCSQPALSPCLTSWTPEADLLPDFNCLSHSPPLMFGLHFAHGTNRPTEDGISMALHSALTHLESPNSSAQHSILLSPPSQSPKLARSVLAYLSAIGLWTFWLTDLNLLN